MIELNYDKYLLAAGVLYTIYTMPLYFASFTYNFFYISNDDLIELKYFKGNHDFSVYITWRLREKVWVNGENGGGGGLTSYKHLLFKRNLPFSQIVWDIVVEHQKWNRSATIRLWNSPLTERTEIAADNMSKNSRGSCK